MGKVRKKKHTKSDHKNNQSNLESTPNYNAVDMFTGFFLVVLGIIMVYLNLGIAGSLIISSGLFMSPLYDLFLMYTVKREFPLNYRKKIAFLLMVLAGIITLIK